MISTESISTGIHIYEFNWFKENGEVTMINFPVGSFHKMLHYLNVHLKSRQVNNILRGREAA